MVVVFCSLNQVWFVFLHLICPIQNICVNMLVYVCVRAGKRHNYMLTFWKFNWNGWDIPTKNGWKLWKNTPADSLASKFELLESFIWEMIFIWPVCWFVVWMTPPLKYFGKLYLFCIIIRSRFCCLLFHFRKRSTFPRNWQIIFQKITINEICVKNAQRFESQTLKSKWAKKSQWKKYTKDGHNRNWRNWIKVVKDTESKQHHTKNESINRLSIMARIKFC